MKNSDSFSDSDVRLFFATLEQAGVMQLSNRLNPLSAFENGEDLTFDDLSADSFTFLELSIKLEEVYKVTLTPEEIQAQKTVMKLFRKVFYK